MCAIWANRNQIYVTILIAPLLKADVIFFVKNKKI